MEKRILGRTGRAVSVVGLGCNNFGGAPIKAPSGTLYGAMSLEDAAKVINAAFDSGVTFFDTAQGISSPPST